MTDVFRYRKNQPVNWFHSNPARSNAHCVYCGRDLRDGSVPSNKEHLIGRSFVPRGTLQSGQAFNFIFRACLECNLNKSTLEGHISAITMLSSPSTHTDESLKALAQRKAQNEHHPIENKPVTDSSKRVFMNYQFGSLSMQFRLTAPPQAATPYVRELAFAHIQGLFTLVTSTNPMTTDGTRILPKKSIYYFNSYHHGDWGNSQLQEMSRRVNTWTTPAVIHSANGFFKAVLRCDASHTNEWFWALEWNKHLRVIGGISKADVPKAFTDLPKLDWSTWHNNVRTRLDQPLDEDQDMLFPDDLID